MGETGKTRKSRKVLVADDDPMIRLLARATLENLGLEVSEAGDGVVAVSLFEKSYFDLVLLDLDMPRLDGLSACAKMRSTVNGERATIVVVTGKSDSDSIRRAYDAGATDFLIKPLNWQIMTHHVPFILRAQEAFQTVIESRSKLHEAQRIARIGGWDWSPETGESEWSVEMFHILGLDPDSSRPSYDQFLRAVHPQDRPELNLEITKAMEIGGEFSAEFRLAASDLESNGRSARYSSGHHRTQRSGSDYSSSCILRRTDRAAEPRHVYGSCPAQSRHV